MTKYEKIDSIFKNTNNWLKFAEAKNAALIVFNISILPIFVSIFNRYDNTYMDIYFYNIILFISLSTLLLIISFLPTLKLTKTKKDNLLYFNNIKGYSEHEYKEKLIKHLEDEDLIISEICNQILENSKITSKKYLYFKFSALLSIAAIFTPFAAFLIFICHE